MKKTAFCCDRGGPYGLTCGYWTKYVNNIDKHVLAYHLQDSDVFDVTREEK